MLGVGGKQLTGVPISDLSPVTPAMVFNFAATLIASVISWSAIAPDYGVYHTPKAST